jgi:hypothetical protein
VGFIRDRQTEIFCWDWAAWATFFAGSGLGRVEAFLAQAHLGHIWTTYFLEILLGLGWAGNFLAKAQALKISKSHKPIFYSKLTNEHDGSTQNAWFLTLSRPKTDR